MKKLSKIFAVVLCLVMAVSMLTVGASAAEEKSVEFTVDSLGLGAYGVGSTTVDGVAVEWTELGAYGYGIQMRIKNGNTATLWNTSATAGGITKIELTFNNVKNTFDNADAVIVNFGSSAKGADYSTKLSTIADVKTYTITPDATTYTYFYIQHDINYTFYWDSIKVYYAEAEVEQPEVTTEYYVAGEAGLCGSEWNPGDEANIMTKGEDGLYTKVYENVAADTYELKVTVGDWTKSWGDPTSTNGNYFATVEALSTVTVIFNPETETVSVEVVPVETEPENPGEGEQPGEGDEPGEVNPGTGDLAIAGLVVAMMAATAGVVVLKKKEF